MKKNEIDIIRSCLNVDSDSKSGVGIKKRYVSIIPIRIDETTVNVWLDVNPPIMRSTDKISVANDK